MKHLLLRILFPILVLSAVSYTIHRDILLEREGACDLRNRIVGARLQKDGVLPYFHKKWKPGQSMRYYDPTDSNGKEGLSNITATPFFHALLYPLAEFPQRTISYWWLIIQYGILIIIVILAYSVATTPFQRLSTILAGTLFLFTEAWKMHVLSGQMYIIIPLFALLFYCSLRRPDNLLSALTAGTAAIALLLIRPNAIIFFLPFILLLRNYRPRYLLVFFSSVLLIALFHFGNKNNRLYWQDYTKAIDASVKMHQDAILNHETYNRIVVEEWEGWNTRQVKEYTKHNQPVYSENGNVFVLYFQLFHKPIPVNILSAFAVLTIVTALLLFYFSSTKYHNVSLENLAMFSFCLFMISDLFSPVWRHQYNTVMWIFPLVLSTAIFTWSNKWIYALLGIALFLNIVNIFAIKMEHTIGEYLFLIIFLYLSITRNLNPTR